MADSDSSSLSSAPPTDDEAEKVIVANLNKPKGIGRYFKPAPKSENVHASPPPPKREPSPPHEYVFADNPDIAFIVMFRARFHEAFPRSVPHLGPQDIETGVTDPVPDEQVERLLCGLLGLVLNRKKDVERGHYGRALEDSISSHPGQWKGGKDFNAMDPTERLRLLKTLIFWSLSDSEAVGAILKESYKSSRQNDDRNVGIAVVPWFIDTFTKRKYYLVEGQDDTHFRLYRENNAINAKTNTWFSVAGSIEEVTVIADKFNEETASQSKMIASKIKAAIPRFETGEEKRRRRDYRVARKAAFARPEPGFSLYEGRTRGKKMKYTFSDDEDGSDDLSARRSTRNSGFSTPLENLGPKITSSGRQVKSRLGGMYGETMLVDQRKEMEAERAETADAATETSDEITSVKGHPYRSLRVARSARRNGGDYTNDVESEEESDAAPSEDEWSGNEEEPDESEPDLEGEAEDEDMNDEVSIDDEEDENTQESLVVQLRYRKGGGKTGQQQGEPLSTSTSLKNSIPSRHETVVSQSTNSVSMHTTDTGHESSSHDKKGVDVEQMSGMGQGYALPNGGLVVGPPFHAMHA